MSIEKYIHHGIEVSVDSKLKGKHKSYCLCHNCKNLDIYNPENNCTKANKLYELCKEEGILTVIFECPDFVESI